MFVQSEGMGLTKVMASSPITSWQRDGETMRTETHFILLGSKINADGYCSHEIKGHLPLRRKDMTNSILKSRDVTLPTKACLVKAKAFPVVMHVWIWELDQKEDWAPKNWCFSTVVFRKTHYSPLDCKEIQPLNPKKNQFWTFTGKTDAGAEAPVLWPLDSKSWLIRKDPVAGKGWNQEEKGMTEDEIVGWHHRLHVHELSKHWEMMKNREAWCAVVHGAT